MPKTARRGFAIGGIVINGSAHPSTAPHIQSYNQEVCVDGNHMNRRLVVAWTLVRVALVVLCVGWLALRLRRFDRVIGPTLPAGLVPLGIALLIAGGLVVLYCGTLLSTPGLLPREFVAFGPFRYVRNPMSLGAVAMLFGLGLFCRSISILGFAVVFFLAMHAFVVYLEEPDLQKRFGESYLQYKQSVNRWIPGKPNGSAPS